MLFDVDFKKSHYYRNVAGVKDFNFSSSMCNVLFSLDLPPPEKFQVAQINKCRYFLSILDHWCFGLF